MQHVHAHPLRVLQVLRVHRQVHAIYDVLSRRCAMTPCIEMSMALGMLSSWVLRAYLEISPPS